MAMLSASKSLGSCPVVSFRCLSGLPRENLMELVSLIFDEKNRELIFTDKRQNGIIRLRFSQLVSVEVLKDHEISVSENSVVDGALAGGVLFGSLGAIVGGMSGIGVKKSRVAPVLRICYRPSSSPGQVQSILLEIADFSDGAYALCDKLSLCVPSLAPVSASAASSPPSSVADELLKFKQLLDMGAITQEEFYEQKRRLLGS